MTIRAVLLGLVGAVFVCAFTYFNDHVIRQTYMVGSSMPTAVYGGLLVILLLVNPLLRIIKKRWELSGTELAVAMALTLAACCIPSAGLMETFPDVLMMPHHRAKTDAGWKGEDALSLAPRSMIADVSEDGDKALNGYVMGLSSGRDTLAVSEVPWSAWIRTLTFWVPVMVLTWGALLGLSLVVHRQWCDHERLPYPIATFANALVDGTASEKPIYLQRLFWLGCGAVCFVHLVNYAFVWWPQNFIRLPTQFDLTSLAQLAPTFTKGGGMNMLKPILFFTVIGLAFLLPKDVSFSMGVGPYLYFTVAGILAGAGIALGGGGMYQMNLQKSLQAGAYAGMLLVVLYTGRRYYLSVLRSALGMKSADQVESQATWGMRTFFACALLLVVVLAIVGLDWQIGLLFVFLMFAIFIVIGRISAETGHIFIQPYWEPAALIVALMGVRAIGPSTAVILFLLSTVLLIDTREALVPFMLNSFKVLNERKVGLSRTTLLSGAALVLGLAVAVPVTLYLKYDQGTDKQYVWASEMAPRFSFDEGVRIKQRLKTHNELESAESVSGFARLLAVSPDGKIILGFVIALGAYLAMSFARLRVPWWPLHPILLLMWSTFAGWRFAASMLIGCVIKWAITKYGGDKAYRLAKPVMIGIIAGDMMFGILTSFIGGVYFLITGSPPPRFVVLVG